MIVEIGEKISGFVCEDVVELPAYETVAYTFRHEPSGAPLYWLSCDDREKAFSVSFKTPPANSTGVFHIIEHSVLDGSEHYPVKDPFVTMLKSSAQVFLNAFTGSNFTCYPFATTNDIDYLNLMDVYMDAVLHPLFMTDPDIMAQEGWHLELDAEGNLVANGIVLNEMKDALAEPMRKLMSRGITPALFPDNAIGFESGGAPESIVNLTLEEFRDTYLRHYRLSNCCFTLYGDVDIRQALEHLDVQHLMPVLEEHAAREGSPNPLTLQSPVTPDAITIEDAIPEQAAIGLVSAVVPYSEEPWDNAAAQVLTSAYLEEPTSPLLKPITDEGIAQGCLGGMWDSGVPQPMIVVMAQGLREDGLEDFRSTLFASAEKVLEQGIDVAYIQNTIDSMELGALRPTAHPWLGRLGSIRECWLNGYDPYAMLRLDEMVEWLRSRPMEYYENLMRELFVKPAHFACGQIVPGQPQAENADDRFEQMAAEMSAEDLQRIGAEAEALHERRLAPDTQEAVATVPQLTLADLQDASLPSDYDVLQWENTTVIRNQRRASGLVSLELCYDISNMPAEDLPYIKLLSTLLDDLGTRQHDPEEMAQLKRSLGDFGFSVDIFNRQLLDKPPLVTFAINLLAIQKKLAKAMDLFCELNQAPSFEDRELLASEIGTLVSLSVSKLAKGDSLLMRMRASAHLSGVGAIQDAVKGLDWVRFCAGLPMEGEKFDGLINRLAGLAEVIFSSTPSYITFAGTDEQLKTVQAKMEPLLVGRGLAQGEPGEIKISEMSLIVNKNEVFATTGDQSGAVSHVYKGFNLSAAGIEFTGDMRAACTLVDMDKLWNDIRVKGGAYGGSCTYTRNGTVYFNSYRDPRPNDTVDVFDGVPEWLAETVCDAEGLEGPIISNVAKMDAPLNVLQECDLNINWYLTGWDAETFLKVRSEILAAKPDALTKLSEALTATMDEHSTVCACGPVDEMAALAEKLGCELQNLLV